MQAKTANRAQLTAPALVSRSVATRSSLSCAPFALPIAAGEVGDLALDDGRSARYLAFQAGSACSLRARCKMASQGWIVIVRSRRDVVQLCRIGQSAQ